MPVWLPEPTGVSPEGNPLWKCAKCQVEKELQEFGFRKRDDIYPDQNVWNKQSYCGECRSQ